MSDTSSDKGDATPYVQFESTTAMFRHLDKRVSAVEAQLSAIETNRAVGDEKRKFLEARFAEFNRRLDKIDGHISRLVWLIIAAILGGFMSFVMQGNIFHA